MFPNITVSISGLPKSGKSHLALTFPDPIVVFSFDLGLEPLLKKFSKKNITVKAYPTPIIDTARPKPYAKEIWEQFNKDYKQVIWDKEVKTVILDPATTIWEIVRHSWTEELGQKQLMPVQYSEPNARMSALLTEPRISGVNLVSIHYLKDVYVNDKATGELELDGFKRTEGMVDIVLLNQRQVRQKKNVIVTTIKDHRFELSLNGMELETTTYDELVTLLGLEV